MERTIAVRGIDSARGFADATASRATRTSRLGIVETAAPPVETPRGDRRRRVKMVQLGVGVVVMIVTFAVFVPTIADYGSVWDAVRSMKSWQVALLVAVAALNVLTFAPDWMVLLPGLRFRQALEVTMASTAVANVMPAGGAVSFAISWTMFREWGFESRAVARALILNGITNNMLNVAYPLLAIVLLASTGQTNAFLTRAAIVGAVVFVLSIGSLIAIVHSEKQALRAGRVWDSVATFALRLVRRGPVSGSGLALARFRQDSIELVRRRWFAMIMCVLVGTMTVFLVLVVALKVTGIGSSDVTIVEAFTAWSLVRLLTALPLTPGGIGITELGLVGTLTQFGGEEAKVVAAVLLFRALTLLPPIAIGALVAFTWRRHERLVTPT
jgi:putative heme transporter